MHVMHLMHHPIQAERQETKYAEDYTIEFIQTTALSQQTVRGLVKANKQSVHEIGGDQDERQGQPKPSTPHHSPERDFCDTEREHKGLECDAAHVVLSMHLGNACRGCRYVCHFSLLERLFAFLAHGKYFPPPSRIDAQVLLFQVVKREFPGTAKPLQARRPVLLSRIPDRIGAFRSSASLACVRPLEFPRLARHG